MALVGAKTFKNFIGGEWVDAGSGETFESLSPATGEVLGTFPKSGAEDIDRAVAAAKTAFEEWRLVPATTNGGTMAVTVRTLDNFVGGKWVPASSDVVRKIVSPVTGETISRTLSLVASTQSPPTKFWKVFAPRIATPRFYAAGGSVLGKVPGCARRRSRISRLPP